MGELVDGFLSVSETDCSSIIKGSVTEEGEKAFEETGSINGDLAMEVYGFSEAVTDANKAMELDASMSKAYLRKATACMKLEEYQTAKAALENGAALAPGDSRFSKLIKECEERISEEQVELPKQMLKEVATNSVPQKEVNPVKDVPVPMATNAVPQKEFDPVKDVPVPTAKNAVPAKEVKHSFYQKLEEVVVTIFAKGIPRECVKVDYGEQILNVAIEVPGKDSYHFQPRLFVKIIPDRCRYDVLSIKIEIRLVKAEPIHWATLEFSREVAVPQRVNVSSGKLKFNCMYPSSKPKRVDWDKIEAQVKEEEKDEKLDGDAALNKFFRDIYQDADEDARRAMQKSFVESNGTVLSTNWKEVGAKKVEGSPPDGMEMKEWEY
ncbi:protein SGT1 homolog B-like [Hibiscus syriacus]|nr:protein SGT1 homolog B-like [Hibiscus syriacus]